MGERKDRRQGSRKRAKRIKLHTSDHCDEITDKTEPCKEANFKSGVPPGSSSGHLSRVKEVVSSDRLSDSDSEDDEEVCDILQGFKIHVGDEYLQQDQYESPLRTMSWMIFPVDIDAFHDVYFEECHFHVHLEGGESRFLDLISVDLIFQWMRDRSLVYGLDVDVTLVEDGERKNFNYNCGQDRCGEHQVVMADSVIRRYEKERCSIRILHPQRFSDELWKLMYMLECYWGSCVGCNSYLTPAGSQGFAPHFDDIDAFILQVSGKKIWRLYDSVDEQTILPRYSSRDFTRVELGDPRFEIILQEGDLLYLPRGVIHEAESLPGDHSLHVTISCNQRNNNFEFMTKLVADTLEKAAQESIRMRKTLDPHMLQQCHSLTSCPDIAARCHALTLQHLIDTVENYTDINLCVDKMLMDFMLNRLPPPPSMKILQSEASSSRLPKVRSESILIPTYRGDFAYPVLDSTTDPPVCLLCHCLSNPREVHQTGQAQGSDDDLDDKPLPQLELPLGCIETLQILLSSTASDDDAGISLADVPETDDNDVSKVALAQALVDAGILTVVAV
jgi:lysine-specific demethylase/histidyl-hydroxylase NO66